MGQMGFFFWHESKWDLSLLKLSRHLLRLHLVPELCWSVGAGKADRERNNMILASRSLVI
jgi:hypothetical protein